MPGFFHIKPGADCPWGLRAAFLQWADVARGLAADPQLTGNALSIPGSHTLSSRLRAYAEAISPC